MAYFRKSRTVAPLRPAGPREHIREHLSRLIEQYPGSTEWAETVAAIDSGEPITVHGWQFRCVLSRSEQDIVTNDGRYVLHSNGTIEPTGP